MNQYENRQKLADMLEFRVTDEQFKMRDYANLCGTVGCALGIAVLSGEFEGLGWNRKYKKALPQPVIGGKFVLWRTAGAEFFGYDAHDDVFTNHRYLFARRKEVADALRAIPR